MTYVTSESKSGNKSESKCEDSSVSSAEKKKSDASTEIEARTEIEAKVFRKLVAHLQQHTEVQNIDLMILADFCRNCLAKWYVNAATEMNQNINYEQAREYIYGEPYNEWKNKYQLPATEEQLAKMKAKSSSSTKG